MDTLFCTLAASDVCKIQISWLGLDWCLFKLLYIRRTLLARANYFQPLSSIYAMDRWPGVAKTSQIMTKVKVINNSGFPLPTYQTEGSAGLDLQAVLKEAIVLKPLERALVKTGLFIALEAGYEAQVRPRSGLAFKQGISVLNAPGTIDADYRGEIGVILVNLSNAAVSIAPGDRIAQLVIAQYARIDWELSESLDETERGAGGFGSTGKK